MIKVLVSGGIGAGKSTVCKRFEALDVPVFYSDIHANMIINSDESVISKIKEAFGEDLYENKILDKECLSSIVFQDSVKLNILNSIVHPAMIEAFSSWCSLHQEYPYVINESAIALDLGLKHTFDFVVVISADEDIRISRVMKRDNCTEEAVRDRIKHQMSEEEKVALSDFVIKNNDFPNVECQVKSIHNNILNSIKK